MQDVLVSAVSRAGRGFLASAIVLRAKPEGSPHRFATHLRIWQENGTVSHSQGAYFDKGLDAATSFLARCERLEVEPFPEVESPRGPDFTHRIRRCTGNKVAWLLCPLNEDGTESQIGLTYHTAMSLDSLIEHAPEFARIDFVLTPAE